MVYRKLNNLFLIIVFNCFYQISLGQDSTNSHKQPVETKSSYEIIGLSKEQIATLDSINRSFKKREDSLMRNEPKESRGKALNKLSKKWKEAEKQVMTKEQYQKYLEAYTEIIIAEEKHP